MARIKNGDFVEANQIIKEDCIFSGVCGLVCPVEKLCVNDCCITDSMGPVPINHLQRFVAIYELEHGGPKAVSQEQNGKKVGVVGGGPAGLAAAASLARKGYDVSVFESSDSPGGMMAYSIPDYRLPREVLEAEIGAVKQLGVKILTKTRIGGNELVKWGFDAVLLSTGAWSMVSTDVPGSDLEGVFQGLDFLRKLSTPDEKEKIGSQIMGKKVAVIGGGDVAMDASISAALIGAKRTHLLYRRSSQEMPAIQSEISLAKEKGVMFWTQAIPTRIVGDNQGRVKAIECLETEMGEKDASGRRKPIPLSGTEFRLDVDFVIEAVGQGIDRKLLEDLKLQTNTDGTIKVKGNGETSKPGFFAAGDITSGGATVVEAIAQGVKVANAVDEYLSKV
jgi:glutamate synthase (NADPH/NADH) small chain